MHVDLDLGPSPSSSSPPSGTSVSTGMISKTGHVAVGDGVGLVQSVFAVKSMVGSVGSGPESGIVGHSPPPTVVVEDVLVVSHTPDGFVIAGHGGRVRVLT